MKKVSALSIAIATASILGFANQTIVQAQISPKKNVPKNPKSSGGVKVKPNLV